MRVSKAKRRERLLTLAVKLAQVDEEQFDMRVWGQHDPDADHEPSAKNYCGTSACALGWAGTILGSGLVERPVSFMEIVSGPVRESRKGQC